MAEYIDKEKLLQKLSRMIEYCKNDNKVNGLIALFQVGDAIMDCPTADVQEVRHGKWIRGNYVCGEYEFRCSVCGNTEWHTSYSTPFCPHCGAIMDLDENEYR